LNTIIKSTAYSDAQNSIFSLTIYPQTPTLNSTNLTTITNNIYDILISDNWLFYSGFVARSPSISGYSGKTKIASLTKSIDIDIETSLTMVQITNTDYDIIVDTFASVSTSVLSTTAPSISFNTTPTISPNLVVYYVNEANYTLFAGGACSVDFEYTCSIDDNTAITYSTAPNGNTSIFGYILHLRRRWLIVRI
jgi:hypothetical protein